MSYRIRRCFTSQQGLGKKNKELESCPLVRVPDTVVYEHNFPRGWYCYDSKNSELKKKSGKELETNAIFKEFSKQSHPDCEIVASYLSRRGDAESGEEVTQVEFLNKQDLNNFLFKREKREQGILQKFVIPKGVCNSVVQAIWSPHVTLVERRNNTHKLIDHRYSMYDRAVTYEGPAHHSSEVFCAPQLVEHIKQICQTIVDHFWSTEHKNIIRMVLYFKVDAHNNVWLLWSSSLRVADKYQIGRTVPLNLSPKFFSPEDSRLALSAAAQQQLSASQGGGGAASTQKSAHHDDGGSDTFHCPNCNDIVDGSRYEIPLEKVISFLTRPPPGRRSGSPNRPASPESPNHFINSRPARAAAGAADELPSRSAIHSNSFISRQSADGDESALDASVEGGADVSLSGMGSLKLDALRDDDAAASSSEPISSGLESSGPSGLQEGVDQEMESESNKRKQIHAFINEHLDDLVYEAYSHFLYSQRPFAFTLPSALLQYKAALAPTFARSQINQVGDSNSFTLSNQGSSIGKLQREFSDIKEIIRRLLNEESGEGSRIVTPHHSHDAEEDLAGSSIRARRFASTQRASSPSVGENVIVDLVPPLLRKFLPDISNDEYKQLAQEPIFLSRTVELCQMCFLEMSKHETISGSLLKIDASERVARSSTLRARSSMAGSLDRSPSPSRPEDRFNK